MESNFKFKLKNAARRLSGRKGSYEVGLQTPSFKVKALCPEGVPVETVDCESSNQSVDMAFGSIGSLASENKPDCILRVSIRDGIEVISKKSKTTICNYKIHQVGYCNVDKRYPQIFVFIAAEGRTDLKCHIFLCEELAQSRAICLTFAKTFENSFQNWQKSKEMAEEADTFHNSMKSKVIDRRRSAGVVKIPTNKQLEKRRASDFVTNGGLKRLNIRRSSADAVHRDSSDDELYDDEAAQAYQDLLSKSAENGTCSLLRRGSTDWDAIEKDEEVQRKMQGDLILWE